MEVTYEYFHNGLPHRDDGPAKIYPDGSEEWYQHGLRHRDDGPAITRRGHREWYQYGLRHRDRSPAVKIDGQKSLWFIRGKKVESRW